MIFSCTDICQLVLRVMLKMEAEGHLTGLISCSMNFSVGRLAGLSSASQTNAITLNICFIKGSHKYDVFGMTKVKHIAADQIKTAFCFFFHLMQCDLTCQQRYLMSSGAILKQCHLNKQKDDFISVLQ